MEINTKTFGQLTLQAFNKSVGYFKRSATAIKRHFETGVIFGVAAVYGTGDYTHINKLLPALVLAGLEPKFYRTVVAHKVVPFKYDRDTCQYIGKIYPGLRAAMEVEMNGVPQWEIVLRAALDGELPENKSSPAWKLETRMPGLIKKALEEGYTVKQIRAEFAQDMKGLVNIATPAEVQQVSEGLKQEKKDNIKAAANAA